MIKLFLTILITLLSFNATAGMVGAVPISSLSPTTENDNSVYAGLKWTLNQGAAPEVVVGYRHASVDSDGDTDGGDISFSFAIFKGFQAGKLRAKYFNGQENVQGEIGAGFDFANGLFIGAGAKGPFTTLGIDYLLSSDASWQAYFMLDTLKKRDKPQEQTVLTCPSGYYLNTGTGNCDFGSPPD